MMDEEFNSSFYIGESVASPVKQMNYESLKGFKKTFKTKWILGTTFMWNYGVIRLIFKKFDYYLLIGEPSILSHWVILLIGKILGKKVFTWGHGIKCTEKKKLFWFEKLFYRLPYKVFVYGEHAKNNMIKLNYNKEKIIPIYNSLDYLNQKSIKKESKTTNIFIDHFKNENPVIIYVGRILYSKKLNILIEALDHINKTEKKANLVIVGPEVDDDSIPKLVKKLELENEVWFYGPCYKEKIIAELFANSVVSVTPGNIGLTAIHSLTYGCPVITHHNLHKHGPEFEVIEEGITGSFFKEDNLDDLVFKIKYWLAADANKRLEASVEAEKVIDEKWNPLNQIRIFKSNFSK
ncbi:glycosyltransferase [Maribacter hydrothermalis]|nr:glycosyltransferase [Maribacter hydrothermalis]